MLDWVSGRRTLSLGCPNHGLAQPWEFCFPARAILKWGRNERILDDRKNWEEFSYGKGEGGNSTKGKKKNRGYRTLVPVPDDSEKEHVRKRKTKYLKGLQDRLCQNWKKDREKKGALFCFKKTHKRGRHKRGEEKGNEQIKPECCQREKRKVTERRQTRKTRS